MSASVTQQGLRASQRASDTALSACGWECEHAGFDRSQLNCNKEHQVSTSGESSWCPTLGCSGSAVLQLTWAAGLHRSIDSVCQQGENTAENQLSPVDSGRTRNRARGLGAQPQKVQRNDAQGPRGAWGGARSVLNPGGQPGLQFSASNVSLPPGVTVGRRWSSVAPDERLGT